MQRCLGDTPAETGFPLTWGENGSTTVLSEHCHAVIALPGEEQIRVSGSCLGDSLAKLRLRNCIFKNSFPC